MNRSETIRIDIIKKEKYFGSVRVRPIQPTAATEEKRIGQLRLLKRDSRFESEQN